MMMLKVSGIRLCEAANKKTAQNGIYNAYNDVLAWPYSTS